jgi:cell migration-inducing and hyaluronan-binding protein
MCSFVKGNTYIKRNLIQSSNQRCTVIHGTHGVNIEQNVVFESFGHCFMLEDGGEINNRFVGNLAASQRATEVEKLVRPNESDNSPSSFWISNPLNTFIANVAAGGEGSGYWLELQSTVKSPSVPVVEGAMSGAQSDGVSE